MPSMMTPEERANWKVLLDGGIKRAAKLLKEHGMEQPYAPGGDNVLVLRLPAPPILKMTAGGLHIPDISQEAPEPKSEGYLIAAGPAALGAFMDAGYLIGDLVQIGRFAGWEKYYGPDAMKLEAEGKGKKKILQMKSGDILGSFDLLRRLNGPEATMELRLDDETEDYVVRVLS